MRLLRPLLAVILLATCGPAWCAADASSLGSVQLFSQVFTATQTPDTGDLDTSLCTIVTFTCVATGANYTLDIEAPIPTSSGNAETQFQAVSCATTAAAFAQFPTAQLSLSGGFAATNYLPSPLPKMRGTGSAVSAGATVTLAVYCER